PGSAGLPTRHSSERARSNREGGASTRARVFASDLAGFVRPRSFATSARFIRARGARSSIVDRCQREARLQGIRGQTLLLRLELANRDRGEITVLCFGRDRQTRNEPFDTRTQTCNALRERLGAGRIFLSSALDEHPAPS